MMMIFCQNLGPHFELLWRTEITMMVRHFSLHSCMNAFHLSMKCLFTNLYLMLAHLHPFENNRQKDA